VPTPHHHSTPRAPQASSSPEHSSRPSPTAALARLAHEDVVGQLRRREGAMLRFGSENGVPMLDWVDAVPRLLSDPAQVETVEQEAQQLIARGIRHIVWAGMGGSVLAVQVLCALGFCGQSVRVHPLDSTDPRALNHLVRQLADSKGIVLPASASPAGSKARMPAEDALYRTLLADVVMVGVAMGKTSEEPISHLDWFAELLRRGGLPAADHLLVMSIPDSYLERYAESHGIPRMPLQLDGGAGTPGRMSAPATRVFLLPAAIDLAARGAAPGTLRNMLAKAWATYDLDGAATSPREHPFVRLAAALASAATEGACALWLILPAELDPLRWWMEQLMEESLGKGGKGIVVFADQALAAAADAAAGPLHPLGDLRLRIVPESAPDGVEPPPTANIAGRSADGSATNIFTLYQPLLASETPVDKLAGLAASFLGLQLCMALFGYLYDIPFAGQPAVEQYKSRARALRAAGDPIQIALDATTPSVEGRIRLLPPPGAAGAPTTLSPTEMLAAVLTSRPTYLDLTINGEMPERDTAALETQLRQLGNTVLGVPVKLRHAPAAYHSTEQSEMDGPTGLVSVRALAEQSDASLLGSYDATFLRAQAMGTWMAMNEQGRPCFMLVYDGTDDDLGPGLIRFLITLTQLIAPPSDGMA
jgi:hypothetical protein